MTGYPNDQGNPGGAIPVYFVQPPDPPRPEAGIPVWDAGASIYFSVTAYGAVGDGVTDDTVAIEAALAAASLTTGLTGQQAIVWFPIGKWAMNVVDTWSGINIEGPGWGDNSAEGPPLVAYFQAFDPTLPVWQFGDDTKTVEGAVLSNVTIYGSVNSGKVGVRFAGGSLRCGIDQVKVYGATAFGIDFLGGAAFASAQNFVTRSYARTFADGAVAMRLRDPTASSSIFSNDHFVSDTALKAGPGGIAMLIDCSTLHSTNLKIDARQGSVVMVKDTATPVWNAATTEVDSAASTDLLVVYKGYSDPTVLGNRFDNPISSGAHVDGLGLVAIGVTTGTVSNGGTSLVVASATGAASGRKVLVRAPSNAYSATILSVSGTTLTLDTVAPAAATGVEVVIGSSFTGVKGFGNQDVALQGAGLQLRDTALTAYPPPGLLPYVAQANGSGSVSPFNLDNFLLFLGTLSNGSPRPLIITGELRSQVTPNSVSRVGSTVTVDLTSVGTGGGRTGCFIKVIGANEDGFNGTYAIALSGNTYTYTSPLSSPDITATGTIKVTVVRQTVKIDTALTMAFGSGGISYDSQSGVFQPLIPSTADGTMTMRGASALTSNFVLQTGSSYTSTSTPVFSILQLTGNTPRILSVSGAGGISMGSRLGPSSLPGLYFTDAAANPTNVLPQNDVRLTNNTGQLQYKFGSDGNVPLAVIRSGNTASRPTGWITGSTISNGGSGGATGSAFALAFSGGTVQRTPAGTFAVSGGAVTSITITDPGQCSVVPTPDFSACSGLSGTSITLTLTFLPTGTEYFDTTLGKPVWLKTPATGVWVDATGAVV